METVQTILNELLKQPSVARAMNTAQWESCMRQAQASKMTGRLFYLLQQAQLTPYIPEKVRHHFNTATIKAKCQSRDIMYEIEQITLCLGKVDIQPIFLKGAAYVVTKCAHQGRLCNDIDILVAPSQLAKAEQQLGEEGWVGESISAYDNHYYRKWMHELPPMLHLERKSVLDVHHHILPKTTASTFDISMVLANTTKHPLFLRGRECTVTTMTLMDRILHSACHLFSEGALDKGLRDLTDLHIMLINFHQQNGEKSVTLLSKRAHDLNLSHQLVLATRYIDRLLLKQIDLRDYSLQAKAIRPFARLRDQVLDWCYMRLFIPHHSTVKNLPFHLAAFIIFVRSHYLKMPLRLLIPHLTVKCWHNLKETFASS